MRPESTKEFHDGFRDILVDSSLKFLSYIQDPWLPEAVSIFRTGSSVAGFCMLSLCPQLAELQTGFKVVEDQVIR